MKEWQFITPKMKILLENVRVGNKFVAGYFLSFSSGFFYANHVWRRYYLFENFIKKISYGSGNENCPKSVPPWVKLNKHERSMRGSWEEKWGWMMFFNNIPCHNIMEK